MSRNQSALSNTRKSVSASSTNQSRISIAQTFFRDKSGKVCTPNCFVAPKFSNSQIRSFDNTPLKNYSKKTETMDAGTIKL